MKEIAAFGLVSEAGKRLKYFVRLMVAMTSFQLSYFHIEISKFVHPKLNPYRGQNIKFEKSSSNRPIF
jgi:hypothetical protein